MREVDISLNDGGVPLGGFAKGRVILSGGKSEQKCNAIEARIERVTTVRVQVDGRSQDKDEVESIQSVQLASYQFTISPDSEQQFDFAFQVPREGGPGTRIKYRIHATADIPGAIDPSKTLDLTVTDAAPAAAGIGDVPSLLQTAKTLRDQGSDHSIEVESLLKQVLALEATNTQALRMLAEVVGWRNDAEAVPVWQRYLSIVPADTEAWEELARNAERRGAMAEALQTFDQAIALAPHRSYLHTQRARVLETMNRDDEAIAAWDAAQAGDSPDDGYAISRAKVLVKQGRRDEAEAALLAIGERCESYRLDDVLTALVDMDAPQHEDRLIARALERNQDDPFTIHEVHAQRLFKRGEHAKSLEAVDRALKGPNHSEWSLSNLILLKGQSFEHLERRADAKAAYKKALDINKDNYEAKTRLKAL
ncbi:MAG: SpoOM protein [Deltaproteobacteria bacterium]|nr:SpoOM protein [Deltaproteobacteria bacterium]